MSPALSWLMGLAAMLGGILMAAQGPIYARMSAALGGNPLFAAMLAFALATLPGGCSGCTLGAPRRRI
ncbi:MAG: hypothetical protein KUA43_15060 [Hoeflea sp.]|uniref:hypothetical protein n=1 Tax=Hoeflea sp. TaxID=1940281 RepID=UPI001D1E008C|nr:hypothetical protein [Hoeflea sp.]MBU4531480.1 hypothetical protein [Alphaproteobacteria bacterium]MBU4544337.1 hypothetical protein [Alphaproteobacteria bacterium]MBU4550426.1 hypothetical protein [Alphaproteobacteria bacterium]MBV1724756.1 hypothetical protein [Hoeflea sp.]MBV1760776.1 hypothetical protein [Hoeflea sp.]